MPALDPDNPEKARPPHRSWRDLPASPPLGDPLPPPAPGSMLVDEAIDEAPVASEPARHSGKKVLAIALVIALLGAVAGGAIWFVRHDDSPVSAAPAATAPPANAGRTPGGNGTSGSGTSGSSTAGGGSSAGALPLPTTPGSSGSSSSGLPDLTQLPGVGQIPGIGGLQDWLNKFGQGFDQFQQNGVSGLLQYLIDQLLGGGDDGSSGGSAAVQPAIVSLGDLPSGYQQGRSSTATSGSGSDTTGTQVIVVNGDKGDVTVEAEKGAGAASRWDGLQGDATTINGHDAKVVDGGVVVRLRDDLTVIVTGAKDVPQDDLKAIAGAVEEAK